LDDGRANQVAASLDGTGLWLPADALLAATGWELKPQGLCRDEVCIPVRAGMVADATGGKRVNLSALAEALARPLATDGDEQVAYLGASAQARADALRSLQAPDFELPDLGGKLHRLSDQRGKKVLLVAYASW
jgi:hypothetical protein